MGKIKDRKIKIKDQPKSSKIKPWRRARSARRDRGWSTEIGVSEGWIDLWSTGVGKIVISFFEALTFDRCRSLIVFGLMDWIVSRKGIKGGRCLPGWAHSSRGSAWCRTSWPCCWGRARWARICREIKDQRSTLRLLKLNLNLMHAFLVIRCHEQLAHRPINNSACGNKRPAYAKCL